MGEKFDDWRRFGDFPAPLTEGDEGVEIWGRMASRYSGRI